MIDESVRKYRRRKTVIDIIQELPKSVIADDIDFKKTYMSEWVEKYGFKNLSRYR